MADDRAESRASDGGSEPPATLSRLGHDMTTPPLDHATHDPLLIAEDLDGTIGARDAIRVQGWLSSCPDCTTLRSDLAALALATRSMATPPRPRDFTLTVADAKRAQVGGWRRIVAAFASPQDTFTRPLAVGLTTLGLAGLVIANIPAVSLFEGAGPGSGASAVAGAPAPEVDASGTGAALGAASTQDLTSLPDAAASPESGFAGQAVPKASDARDNVVNGGGETGRNPDKHANPEGRSSLTTADGAPSLLVVVSILMVLTGLALALLRWGARRLGDG